MREPNPSRDLSGKVCVVTGAARGLGLAQARRLVADGASVLLTDIDGSGVAKAAAALGSGSIGLVHDVREVDDWTRIVDAAAEAYGTIDVLVNNAGMLEPALLAEMEPDAFRRIVDTNLFGAFLGIRAVTRVMSAKDGGSIVNIGSTCGLQGSAFLSAYSASKWALRGLTRSVAIELARSSIRVNLVHPGGIDTAMVRGDMTDEELAELSDRNMPTGRFGQVDEVAAAVAFLASDDSSFCTGAELTVDGGYTAGDFLVSRDAVVASQVQDLV